MKKKNKEKRKDKKYFFVDKRSYALIFRVDQDQSSF